MNASELMAASGSPCALPRPSWHVLRRAFAAARPAGLAALCPCLTAGLALSAPALRRQQQAPARQSAQLQASPVQTTAGVQTEAAEPAADVARPAAQVASLRRQLLQREAVIGQLSRDRDDAAADALGTWSQLWKEGQQQGARCCAGLRQARERYACLAASLGETMVQLEGDQEQPPCTCCGGSRATAAALRTLLPASELVAARGEALGWQEEAHDLRLELADCKAGMADMHLAACREVAHLRRRCQQAEEAAAAAEGAAAAEAARAMAAEAALARQQAEQAASDQQLLQASEQAVLPTKPAPARRLDSSRSFAKRVQLKSAAAAEESDTIPAAWLALSPEAPQQAPQGEAPAALPSRGTHRRTASLVFC
ncbi:hypothetical protein ABPG75_003782 [Micractinium tetrahymenae]